MSSQSMSNSKTACPPTAGPSDRSMEPETKNGRRGAGNPFQDIHGKSIAGPSDSERLDGLKLWYCLTTLSGIHPQ